MPMAEVIVLTWVIRSFQAPEERALPDAVEGSDHQATYAKALAASMETAAMEKSGSVGEVRRKIS